MLKNKLKLIIPILIILLLTIFGVTYTFFEYYKLGNNNNKLIFGNIYLKLDDGTDTLKISNVFPETKVEARDRTDNLLTFTVAGLNTTKDNDIWYQINLVEGDGEDDRTRVKSEHLVFDLIEVDANKNENLVLDAVSFEDLSSAKIWVDRVNRDTTTEIKRTYKLRMWLSEDVFISDTNPEADYSTDVFRNGFASVKISVFGDFKEKFSPILNKILLNNLNSNLKDADTSGTRYLYGYVGNNYLWYSGKLWRIVSLNSDGSIKIVTENNMTTIPWNSSNSDISYPNSQIRSWLKTEFLTTLYKSDELLVNHSWDYSTYSSFPNTKLSSNTVTDTIGTLTIYDFMMTGGTESSSTSNSFLVNNFNWWTMSRSSTSDIWKVQNNSSSISQTNSNGIRPSVNLKSNLMISKGDGTKSNPFILSDDLSSGLENDKLTTRLSGEYIMFEGKPYRIVGVETINQNKVTKVAMVDDYLSNSKYNDSGNYFTLDSGVGKYLNDWYNSLPTTSKDMIATPTADNILWYVGPSSGAGLNYVSSKSNSISATIGLLRFGEMFSAHSGILKKVNNYFWLITNDTNGWFWTIKSYGDAGTYYRSSSYYIRPTFYLKNEVIISDVNGDGKVGTGTAFDPYEIGM